MLNGVGREGDVMQRLLGRSQRLTRLKRRMKAKRSHRYMTEEIQEEIERRVGRRRG